jgi:nicotinate-nucleotide adenylyltransferase
MRLGILGGTFDPIHLGHLLIAELARESLSLERVLFTPAGDPPHKQDQQKTAAHHRRQMVALAIEDNPYFELNTLDLERPGPNYSVDTIRQIRAHYDLPADDCFFIIGGDSLADLPTWHKPDVLIKLCRLAVIHRPGYRPDVSHLEAVIPGLKARLDWVETPAFELSSSLLRSKIRAGHTIRYQIPDKVIAYIERHRLYH